MSNIKKPAPSWLTKDYLEEKLRKCLNDPGLVVTSLNLSSGSLEGENFLGQVIRIKLQLTTNEKTSNLSLIAKLKPETDAVKTIENMRTAIDFHEVESNFFSKTLEELNKILISRGLHKTFAPKFYFSDDSKSIIFMEDLKERNFVLNPQSKFLNLEECLKAVEALAMLHSSSYVLLQNDPYHKHHYQRYIWKRDLDLCGPITHNALESIEEHINSWNLSDAKKMKVLTALDYVRKNGMAVAEPRSNSFTVLAHGDTWKSNLMFRYENTLPKEACLLDYQITNYNSFAIDLQHLLFTSVDVNVIKEHVDEIVLRYHRIFDSVACEATTLENVKKEFSEWYYYGFLMSLIFRPFIRVAKTLDMEKILSGKRFYHGFDLVDYIEDIKEIIDFLDRKKAI